MVPKIDVRSALLDFQSNISIRAIIYPTSKFLFFFMGFLSNYQNYQNYVNKDRSKKKNKTRIKYNISLYSIRIAKLDNLIFFLVKFKLKESTR